MKLNESKCPYKYFSCKDFEFTTAASCLFRCNHFQVKKPIFYTINLIYTLSRISSVRYWNRAGTEKKQNIAILVFCLQRSSVELSEFFRIVISSQFCFTNVSQDYQRFFQILLLPKVLEVCAELNRSNGH